MFAILNKEIRSFFANPVGYLVIGIFLLVTALYLFVFKGDYNILDSGFATLKPFFDMAPWIFVFLIPAITMKSFSEEKKLGTLELLLTKPLSIRKLVAGKFVASLLLISLAILPSIIYVYSVYSLSRNPATFDFGATIGSYLGLILLGACYTAIGIFASTISNNQITAFILAVFFSFLSFYLFEGISGYALPEAGNYGVEYLGISYHYKSISRGVIDTRDIIYFISFILLFLSLAHQRIKNFRTK